MPATKTRPPLQYLTWYGKDKAHWQAREAFRTVGANPVHGKKGIASNCKICSRETKSPNCDLALLSRTAEEIAPSTRYCYHRRHSCVTHDQESTTGEPVHVPLTALTTSASSAAVRMLHTIAVPAPPTTEMTVERHNAAESYCFTALTTGSLPANMPNRLRGAKPPRCSVVEELPVCSRMMCSGKPESAIPVRPHINYPLHRSIVTVL